MAATSDTARYSDLCRLCAAKTSIILGTNIFESVGVCKKIQTCLPVQINACDELPKMICENCHYKVELLFDFRERSIRTESLLIDLFKELNTIQLQVDQHLKMQVAQLEHSDLVISQQSNALLETQNLHHVNELDLAHLTQREHYMGQGIILDHQNVSLDSIEISGHDLNRELPIQTEGSIMVNDVRYSSGIEYHHQGHQILTDQYELSDISLVDANLHPVDKTPCQIIAANPKSQQLPVDKEPLEGNEVENLKNEDSSSEGRLLIDENKDGLPQRVDGLEDNCVLKNGDKQYVHCYLCGKMCENKEAFQNHYNEHINKCKDCLNVFTDNETLLAHQKEVHGINLEETKDICGDENLQTLEKDSSDNELNLDLEDNDETSQDKPAGKSTKKRNFSPKVCSVCNKVCKSNYKLNEHMRKHTGEQPYKCKTCDKAFRSKIGLAQHEAKHTGQYDFACPTCGKGFQCRSYLMVHQRVHSDVKPYPCKECGRNFKTKQSLLDHTNRHLGVKPYACEICGRSFITNGLCKAHQKVHSGLDNRKYSCKICNKMFVSKSYLQTHLRIHTGEKPFQCEVCGKGFLTRVDLKIHSTMHTGEKSYVCEICGKAFARRDALRCHRRSHTGERPYSCDICGQTFTQFSPMAIHKRLHTGERPYECSVCGKKFVSRSIMVVHAKKHVT